MCLSRNNKLTIVVALALALGAVSLTRLSRPASVSATELELVICEGRIRSLQFAPLPRWYGRGTLLRLTDQHGQVTVRILIGSREEKQGVISGVRP